MNKLILLLSLILSVSLFSCDNDKKDDPTPPTPPKPTTNMLKYTVIDVEDLFDMVDITVEYTTADGITVASERMTARTWSKEITGFKTPFRPTMKVSFVKKAGFVAEDKAYTITTKLQYSYALANDNNDKALDRIGGTIGYNTKASVEKRINKLVAEPMVFTFDVPYKKEPSKE